MLDNYASDYVCYALHLWSQQVTMNVTAVKNLNFIPISPQKNGNTMG